MTARLLLPLTAALTLACGGLLGPSGPTPEEEAALDAGDPAEKMRLAGDFQGAENLLNQRLRENPNDARAWRLLGDVNVTRGQFYQQKWRENLVRARDSYANALKVDPTNCVTWSRLAFTVAAGDENDQTRAPRQVIDGWPLEEGWSACPRSVALLEIELRRQPTDTELGLARQELGVDADEGALHAAAAPWKRAALEASVDLSRLEWDDALARPEPGPGVAFAVLQVPVAAAGVDGAQPRSFTEPEWLTVLSAGQRLTYLDRRFPRRIPAMGRVKATACPGTTWSLDGPDKFPVGTCTTRPYEPSASPVYDPEILKPAGPSHYHHPSITHAALPRDGVAEGSVRCTGGPVGRLFVDIPSCEVAYDRAIPQKRSVPANVGLTATSEAHARQMVRVARSAPLYGEELAAHLAAGEVAVGLGYGLFAETQPDLTGCKGRGLYQRTRLVDGALEWTCELGGVTYAFRELTLTNVTR